MNKCRLFLDIIRTICLVLILFIIIGVLVFIYVEKDEIGKVVVSIVNNINQVGIASSSLNKIVSNVTIWIDTNNILGLILLTIKDTQNIVQKNKDFDMNTIVNNLNQLVIIVTNISNVIL